MGIGDDLGRPLPAGVGGRSPEVDAVGRFGHGYVRNAQGQGCDGAGDAAEREEQGRGHGAKL
jgi:hypothetical protein